MGKEVSRGEQGAEADGGGEDDAVVLYLPPAAFWPLTEEQGGKESGAGRCGGV